MTPDVNVLVAAMRRDRPPHAVARSWLEVAVQTATRTAPLTLLPVVVVGHVRVVTDRRFYSNPTTSTADALAFVEALLAQPHVRLVTQGDEWPGVVELCNRYTLAGPILSDAWVAASVLQLNEHLVTFDRGFRRLLPPRHVTVLSA